MTYGETRKALREMDPEEFVCVGGCGSTLADSALWMDDGDLICADYRDEGECA